MPTIEPMRFVEWGHEASKNYLESQTPLNESITKIAERHSLSPMQISRVVEAANLATNTEMFKTAEDKNFAFDLANAKTIIDDLNKPIAEKTASYHGGLPKEGKNYDYKKIFGLEEISNEHNVQEKIAKSKEVLEKLSAAKDEIETRIVSNSIAMDETREQLYKVAKQMVLRGEELTRIAQGSYDVVKEASWDDVKDEFQKIALRLVEDGVYGPALQHKLAEAVDKELISKKLEMPVNKGADPQTGKVRVVNGNHPVFTTVNTLVRQIGLDDELRKSTAILDDKIHYVGVKGKDLNDTKTTDKWVEDKE